MFAIFVSLLLGWQSHSVAWDFDISEVVFDRGWGGLYCDEIESEFKLCLMKKEKADLYCKSLGKRLPTIREFASFAVKNGAHEIEGPDWGVCMPPRPGFVCLPETHMQWRYVEDWVTPNNRGFYFFTGSYLPKQRMPGSFKWFWSSTNLGGDRYGFLYDGSYLDKLGLISRIDVASIPTKKPAAVICTQ